MLAIDGPAARAVQPLIDESAWIGHVDAIGTVIDEWTLRPGASPGGKLAHMTVIGYTRREDAEPRPLRYAVALFTVDTGLSEVLRAFRLPRAVAATMTFLVPLEVESSSQARVAAHSLAHSVTQGALPVHPTTDAQLDAWVASVRMAALVAAPADHRLAESKPA